MIHTIRLLFERDAVKRTRYLRKRKVFRNLGENCIIENRIVPLYSNLISIGNNVHLASGVRLITHDITHIMINNIEGSNQINEKIGCIEIGSNVFIGAYATVLYNVKIGDNVVIGAGSIVTRDIPSNCVVAGVPARIVSSFESYVNRRTQEKPLSKEKTPKSQEVSAELADWCWNEFYRNK